MADEIVAALRLEEFWNEVLRLNAFKLYCAYPIDIFGAAFHLSGIDAVLCAHTHLVPTDPDASLESASTPPIDEVLGPRAEGLKPLIKANFRPSWAELPGAEAVILWIRNKLAGIQRGDPRPGAKSLLFNSRLETRATSADLAR